MPGPISAASRARAAEAKLPAVDRLMSSTYLLQATALVLLAQAAAAAQFELDWESGFPDGTPHLSPRGVEPSFSFNENSNVVTCSSSTSDSRRRCKCGENGYSPYRCEVNYGMSDLHYHEMLTVPWARKGNGVLKFYADGRNAYGQGSGDSSYRCELGAPQDEFIFGPGDETYVSTSFWVPGEFWDPVTRYSTVITQFKMHSDPHGEVRLSNRGDYALFYRNAHGLWDDKATGDDGAPLGHARRNAWNDVKIYCKHSTGSDGRVRVYVNGEKKFEHYGRTLHGTGNSRGYLKFGMYTEIRCADERRSNYHPSRAHAPCFAPPARTDVALLFCLVGQQREGALLRRRLLLDVPSSNVHERGSMGGIDKFCTGGIPHVAS